MELYVALANLEVSMLMNDGLEFPYLQLLSADITECKASPGLGNVGKQTRDFVQALHQPSYLSCFGSRLF